ncbi:MAG: carboxypeptidase regulatory-like domain-containing protein [Planctomycetales bacterium]|nr:carboxypeptidase regulatory-like domain-containing protein [Planctomycetales bacterium]
MLIVTILLSAAVGCGSKEGGVVGGTLKLQDGTPLVKARVTARDPSTGKWGSGVTDDQGAFVLGTETPGEPLPPGTYQLMVKEDRGDWDNPAPPKISDKYSTGSQSGVQFTIDGSGDQQLDLTLDGPGK